MKSYWQHRIKYEERISFPLLDSGILSIGFSDFSEDENITAILNDPTRITLSRLAEAAHWEGCPNSVFDLKRFLQMECGDIVLVPLPSCTFSIYKVLDVSASCIKDLPMHNLKDWNGKDVYMEGNLLHAKGESEVLDIGFFRKVRLIDGCEEIPSENYPLIYRRMKAHQTTLKIDDISESVENAIRDFQK